MAKSDDSYEGKAQRKSITYRNINESIPIDPDSQCIHWPKGKIGRMHKVAELVLPT